MAHLFKIEGNVVYPKEETLLIEPFKQIWERDNSKGKEQAIKDFSYIEFMTSFLESNPFKGYSLEARKTILAKTIYKVEIFKPDELILEGMKAIETFQKDASPTYSLYLSSLRAKDTVQSFLDKVDLTKINFKTGNPMYKPKEITSALLDMDKVSASLDALKKKTEEELYEAVKTKGQKVISPFAMT